MNCHKFKKPLEMLNRPTPKRRIRDLPGSTFMTLYDIYCELSDLQNNRNPK